MDHGIRCPARGGAVAGISHERRKAQAETPRDLILFLCCAYKESYSLTLGIGMRREEDIQIQPVEVCSSIGEFFGEVNMQQTCEIYWLYLALQMCPRYR